MNDISSPKDDVYEGGFVRLLTLHQRDIYLYVRSLVLDTSDVEEIVQDVNLVLWEKRNQFKVTLDFRPWAFQIARYKVSEHRVKRKRKGICFSDAMVDELAVQAPRYMTTGSDLNDELLRCLAQLTASDRQILNQRYSLQTSCENIAETIGRPVRWVYKALNRIRQELFDCITHRTTAWRD